MRTIEQIIDQEIYTNQDSLVRKCFTEEIFEWDDVANLYHGVYDHEQGEEEQEVQEIMQWFSVSERLAKKLIEVGAPVLDSNYGYFWGRCEFGNALKYDSALNAVYALIHKQAAA